MKRSHILLLFVCHCILLSCSAPSFFLPAVTGNDVAYLPKPMEVDSVTSKTYLSASIAGMELPHNSGSMNMGFINISRGHTIKNINFAYGAFGFTGKTSDEDTNGGEKQIPEFDDKNFYGAGLRTSIGYFDNMGNAEFRMLSWDNSLSIENGNYSSFRKRIIDINNKDIVSASKTVLFTTGISTEIIWHSKRKPVNQFAFRVFYGFTPGLNSNLRYSNPNASTEGKAVDFAFYFKLNKFFGIFNTGGNKGFTSKFGLGYSF